MADAANNAAVPSTLPGLARQIGSAGGPAVLAITGHQQGIIHRLVIEAGTELNCLLEHFDMGSLKDLPAAEFGSAVCLLEKRRGAG